MDDRRPATDPRPVSTHTTINTTEQPRSSATLFILGGLVVAVLGIGYFLFSNGSFDQAGTPASGGDVSVTVDTGGDGEAAAPEVAPVAPAESAPAEAAPTEPAPAD